MGLGSLKARFFALPPTKASSASPGEIGPWNCAALLSRKLPWMRWRGRSIMRKRDARVRDALGGKAALAKARQAGACQAANWKSRIAFRRPIFSRSFSAILAASNQFAASLSSSKG